MLLSHLYLLCFYTSIYEKLTVMRLFWVLIEHHIHQLDHKYRCYDVQYKLYFFINKKRGYFSFIVWFFFFLEIIFKLHSFCYGDFLKVNKQLSNKFTLLLDNIRLKCSEPKRVLSLEKEKNGMLSYVCLN